MRIGVIGPPGSGKSTQAELLAKRLNLPHVYVGGLLREEAEKGTELGRRLQAFMNKGELAPDDLVLSLFLDRIERDDCKEGFIADGTPRTMYQVEKIEERAPFDKVVFVDVSFATARERLFKRGRGDDAKEAVTSNRFRRYEEATKPILEFYRETGRLLEVDGEGSIEEVKQGVFEKLGK